MQFLITAGPTREPLDPVRYLTNRSSGKMGYALAAAAARAGHGVVLVSGPVRLPAPDAVRMIQVETAEQMRAAVAEQLPAADIAIMAAAVADYRPATTASQKMKKGADRMMLELVRTPDILGVARTALGFRGVLVGFAAETENLAVNARKKLRSKGCDLVVANDVSDASVGFDAEDNRVALFFADGRELDLPKMPKPLLAEKLVGLALELVKGCTP
ncbi:MAG: phosphopantothenoylcysteine decarboxylase [Verrucomicrobiales bacterium]|nr:phosphopantothenoylcysteine decarboxylase [Verrucomicrobiales bacterium]